MQFLVISTFIIAGKAHIEPPSPPLTLPQSFLNQFLDYEIIVHVDTSSNHLLHFLSQKQHFHQLYLINYDQKTSMKMMLRPDGHKFMNIVILENPFNFQQYSIKPYNFLQYDFVLFVITTDQRGQIWRMAGLNRASGVFIYQIDGRMFHCCYYCGNATAVLKETKGDRRLLNDYSDLNGHVFRIGYTTFPPFFWIGGEELRPWGAEGRLLHHLGKVHNFRYEMVEYQSTPRKGAWEALIEAVEAGDIDWAVGGISMTIRRGVFTDFTRYIKTQGFSIAYAVYQDNWVNFERVLLVFSWGVWFAIITAVILISLLAMTATTLLETKVNFFRFVRICLVAIAEQPVSSYQFKVLTTRSIFLTWWLTSLSLTTVYKSQLASCLIKPKYNEPTKIDELVEKGFHFHVNKIDWSVLKENLETSLDKIYGKVLKRIEYNLEFCESIAALDDRKLAVIDEEIVLQFDIFRSCRKLTPRFRSNLRLVTENIFPSTYHAWSMAMGTPFRLKFSTTIGKMETHGLIHYWYKSASIFNLPRSNSMEHNEETSSLTVIHILPPLMILGLGLGASVFTFFVEIFNKKKIIRRSNYS